MPRQNKKGMWLRQTQTGSYVEYGWLVQAVSALISCVVCILAAAELTGFSVLYAHWGMLLSSGVLCMVYAWMTARNKKHWFYPGALFLLLLLILAFGRQLLGGASLVWNQIGDTWTAQTGWVLPELEVQADPQQRDLLVFSVFAGLVIGFLSCGLSGCPVPVLAFLLPGSLLAGMAVLRMGEDFLYVLPVLLTAVLLLICSSGKKESEQPSAVLSRLLPAAAACGILLAAAMMPDVQAWTAEVSAHVQMQAHERRYETQYTTLPEGNFTDYESSGTSDQPALVVSMENPEAMYLRGFTGAVFEENAWTALDPETLAEHKDLLYWLNRKEFNPHAQLEKALYPAQYSKNTITVQNIGACSKYLYVPFTLCGGSYLPAEDLSQDGIASQGERIYVFSAISGGAECIEGGLENLQTSEEKTVLDYRKAESAYRAFVQSCYLQIPQEVLTLLQPYWEETTSRYGGTEELTFPQAQECVLTFLEACFGVEEKKMQIELPLEMAAGTSYQYATVAALTLRYFGIPARYAEGYHITESMAADAENGSAIKVNSSCAAGWVEVYQDGIGWMPMDLPLGFEERTPNPNESQNSQEKTQDPEEGEELEETPNDALQEPEPQGGYAVTVSQAILWSALLIGVLLVLLFALVYFRHRVLLRRKEKRFDAENPKDAVAWIFADSTILLEKLGLHRGGGSMGDLIQPVRQRFGEEYAGVLEQMIELNARALFSSREMDDSHREYAMAFRAATLQHLKDDTNWYQRIWMRWVLCLY